ncbi:MAG: NAD(P)/FAD-dependent oxidoreductase [Clostridia bacterium]|nr:NAD(P)/FAD-dependent oxidoreductase [Clostridia bacterium]
MRSVLIIGAGAAGLMAAVFAAGAGAEVTVLERNEKPGKKIYLTGKGRCNVTNDCTMEDFLREVPQNPRFLYSALSFFSPEDMKNLLAENGCPTVTQRGRRVFPATEKASDVTRTLVRVAQQRGTRILLNQRVKRLLIGEAGRVTGAETEEGAQRAADAVILATGGVSYPATGSTGDGYHFAAETGHTVLPAIPSLIGLESKEAWPRELQGLSLKNVRITLKKGKKSLYSEQGEMLFTHFGFSGPLILEASCHLPADIRDCMLELDLKPGLTREQLDARLQRDLEAGSRKQIRNILPGLMPGSLAEIFPSICGLPAELPCNQVTASQREVLVNRMKTLPLDISGRRPIAEAVITRGGVSVKEVNPGTMESKLIPGLYFAGEILDVDAHTGGYNLQIAFSTGALAGHSAATAD